MMPSARHHLSARGAPGRSRHIAWLLDHSTSVLGNVAAATGVICLLDVIWPHHWRFLTAVTPILPTAAKPAASAVAVVASLVLLRLATGLRRGRRAAWRLAILSCAAIAAADLGRSDRRFIEAAAALTLMSALICARSRFVARGAPDSKWLSARFAGQVGIFAFAYGMILLYLPGRTPPGTSLLARLREVSSSIIGFGGTLPIRGDRFADTFHATLIGLGLLISTCTAAMLLRAPEAHAHLSADDEGRLRDLLERQGARDSLGYFALRRDKSVVWSPSGRSAIAYRVVRGVALISGDPIGDPEAWPGAIAAYRTLVAEYGWVPAAIGCSERGAIILERECGLSALELGDEAIVTVADFSLSGRAVRGIRQACTRLERAGYQIKMRHVRDIDEREIDALRTAANRWRGEATERGFSMALSRLGDAADSDCLVVTAHKDGTCRGLLHFVPWSGDGISLDLMRRDHDADNGLNEYMIACLLERGPALGITRVSLNFAVFRDALERGKAVGAGPLVRAWRRILLIASRWWQIESLYRFNAKFLPRWQPRYISYASARDLPRVALAAMEAEAFFAPPHLLRYGLGRRSHPRHEARSDLQAADPSQRDDRSANRMVAT